GEIDLLDIIFANMNVSQVQRSQITQIISKPLIMPHTVLTSNRCAAIRCSKYSELWAFIDQKKSSAANNNNEMSIDKENNLEIANLPVTKHKGRSENKRYKSAVEKTRRQPYACHTC
ncbi:3808_t:CDS:2, partial [Dentiscutata heterogama]